MHKTAVVTKMEAMHLLGVKASSLTFLEKVAKIPDIPKKEVYTTLELKRLFTAVRKALKSHT